jgi:hypothetical protein
MEATPLEQPVEEDAENFTGEPTVTPFPGLLTYTSANAGAVSAKSIRIA